MQRNRLTKAVDAGHEFGDVDVASPSRNRRHLVVSVRKLRPREDARDDVARQVVPAAHTAPVQLLLGSQDTITANQLTQTNSRLYNLHAFAIVYFTKYIMHVYTTNNNYCLSTSGLFISSSSSSSRVRTGDIDPQWCNNDCCI